MKNIRRSIILLGVVFVVLIALVIWLARKRIETFLPTACETNSVQLSTASAARSSQENVGSNTPKPSASSQSPNNSVSPIADKKEQMRDGLAELNDISIVFYGVLEDQFKKPVVGAQISADMRIYNGVQSTVEHLKTTSDGNGIFQIKGGKGESLGIVPKKDGYVLAAADTYFKYSYMYPDHFSPDPNNPTVIKMWKLQGAEPLVAIDKAYKLYHAGAPVNFDLVKGEIVSAGGDIKIVVNRPSGIVSQHNPQDWGVRIEAVDGGLIKTSMSDARVTYAAPDNGYQTTDNLVMSTTNHWSDLMQQMYFVTSRNGQVYSKIFISMVVNANPDAPMSVSFRGVANTNGSRNWEASAPQ